MKKILLLLTMVLTTVGAWAQIQEPVSYVVDLTTGKLANYSSGTQGNWNYKWAFTPTVERPCALTLVATNNANNIAVNGNNMNIFAGSANSCTYQLSVPDGYLIESYSFDYVTSGNNAVTITPANGSAVQSSTSKQTLAVNDINARTAQFTLSGGNYGFTSSNFVVKILQVESNRAFSWNTSTSWIDAEGDLSSTILNDNALGYGIKYIEQDITVGGARTATVTFQYTSGNCALNIRGVEVVDACGYIVAGDYHVGKAGNPSTNNVYTVSVAEAGTYKVRIYATFGANDRVDATNGNITVAFSNPDVSVFSHDVTFSAEYATLYLGYKAAIPTGVEAYVVTSAANGWAHLEKVECVLPANTGVILKKVGGETTYTFAYTADDADVNGVVADNLLDGTIANRYVCEEAYVLAMVEGEVGFALASLNQLNEGAFLNNANKVYLPLGVIGEGSNVKALRFNFDGETTAIETVETENANAPIYDLSGRRVLSTVKGGIYIQNGKKFIVK